MIKVLRSLLLKEVPGARYFGLKRPETKYSIKIKELLELKKPKHIKVEAPIPKEPKTKDVVKEKDEIDEVKEMVDKAYPTYGWTDLDSLNSFSLYDHTMHRAFYTSKKFQEKIKQIEGENPVDTTKQMRINFIPTLRTWSIYANLKKHETPDGDSSLVLRSDFKPGEKITVPSPFPLEFKKSLPASDFNNDEYVFKSLVKSIIDIAKYIKDRQNKPIENEEPEDAYPPSLFSYFDTLPLWARKNQGIRNVLMGLEFYKPGIDIWKKEQGLNMAMKIFTRITDEDRVMALAAYDRTKTQLSYEKVLDMVKKYGLYPIVSDLIPHEEKLEARFPDPGESLVYNIREKERDTNENIEEPEDDANAFLEEFQREVMEKKLEEERKKGNENLTLADIKSPFKLKPSELAKSEEDTKKPKPKLPPLKKLNEIVIDDGLDYMYESDPNAVPYEVGELDGEPTAMQLLVDTPEDTKERENIQNYDTIPYFTAKPNSIVPSSYKRPLAYEYTWYPVILI